MTILGISSHFHDAAAAIIQDGRIIAATQEERFTRVKHDASFPKHAIAYCLQAANISPSDLDVTVFYEKPLRKFYRILHSSIQTYPYSLRSFQEAMHLWLTDKLWIKHQIASHLSLPLEKILFCDHHLSHAASTFYPSPWKDAAILTIDGVGEWATTTWGTGNDDTITLHDEIHFPHSIGLLYSTFTAFLGFEVNEGEWKVMGLASYGKPTYVDDVRKLVRQKTDGSFLLDLSYFSFHYSDHQSFSQKFVDLFGTPIDPKKSHEITTRATDIAASIQLVTEELLLTLARAVRKKTQLDVLCLAGGVALNARANYRLLKESGFKQIYIQPAAGDAGGALGAALYGYYALSQKRREVVQHASPIDRPYMTTAYLGQQFNNTTIQQFLDKQHIPYKKYSDNKLISYVADQLAAGAVVGWMQGRCEWGPRSLGARSILADPRKADMKERINAKVKFREAFRPFAPSVLAEQAGEVFDLPTNYDDHLPLRFMLYITPVKLAWRKKVPAINHADNTARPQLVYKEEHTLYRHLIEAFYKKTGVPLLLNTSFNLRGDPIVSSPADAYATFQSSGIDLLVMGNYVCEK